MNRPIRFRAWNLHTKKMLMPSDVSTMPMMPETRHADGNVGTIYLQWTGLTDKNGKEIYEGDILALNVHGGRPKFEVTFENASFQLKSQCALRPAYEWVDELDEPEVIGNVWENPELLNV